MVFICLSSGKYLFATNKRFLIHRYFINQLIMFLYSGVVPVPFGKSPVDRSTDFLEFHDSIGKLVPENIIIAVR